jgi:tyrosine-protein phosphatase SIW14
MKHGVVLFLTTLLIVFQPSIQAGEIADLTTARLAAFPTKIAGVGNFAQLSPALYRGEQPTREGFAELKKLGIKTVVNLRSFHDDSRLLEGTGLRYFRMHEKAWHPEDEDVVAFLNIVANPENQPVFVHCQQGSDRTGYAVAAYRMVEQGWSADDAIAEMHHFAFHTIWIDIPKYLKQFNVVSIRAKMANAKSPNGVK